MSAADRDAGQQPNSTLDLIAVAVVTVLMALFVFVPPLSNTPFRPILGLAFVFLVPGYTLVAALLPSQGVLEHQGRTEYAVSRLGHTSAALERLVFGFGVSVALTILLGLALGLTERGITAFRLFVGLTAVTALGLPVAVARRQRRTDTNRLSPEAVTSQFAAKLAAGTRSAKPAVTVVVIAAVVLAVITAGASSGGQESASLTEMYLLSGDGAGEYNASEYPASLTTGEPQSFAVGISNQEGAPRDYTVLAVLQTFDGEGESRSLVSQRELQRFDRTIQDGRTERIPHEITPADRDRPDGRSYRLAYLLYTGEPPASPSTDNAYREVHLWIDIEDSP